LLTRIDQLERQLDDKPAVDVEAAVRAEVEKAVASMPKAEPVTSEQVVSAVSEAVKSLPAAPTVEEVAATFERRFSDLTLSWERQARETFEKAADRMPVPKDG